MSLSLQKTLPLLALALFSMPARADVQVHTVSTNAAEAPFVQELELPRFDASLGELLSVQIRLSTVYEVDVSAENLARVPQIVTVDAAAFSALLDSRNQVLHSDAPFATDVLVLQAFDGTLDGAGPSGVRDQLFSAVSSTVIDVPSENFAPFVGTGAALHFQAEDFSSIGSEVGNVVSDIDVNVAVRIQLIYRYSPAAPAAPTSVQTAQADALRAMREPDAAPLLA